MAPDYQELHLQKARTLVRLGRDEEAIEQLRKPSHNRMREEVLSLLGDLYVKLGKFREAADEYKNLTEIGEPDAVILFKLGYCQMKLNRLNEAEIILAEAARLAASCLTDPGKECV